MAKNYKNKEKGKIKIRIKPGIRVWVDNRLYEGGEIYEVSQNVFARIGSLAEIVKETSEMENAEAKRIETPPADKAIKNTENK